MLIPECVYRSDEFPPGATTVFVADIACILCSRTVGPRSKEDGLRLSPFSSSSSARTCYGALNSAACAAPIVAGIHQLLKWPLACSDERVQSIGSEISHDAGAHPSGWSSSEGLLNVKT